MTISPHDVEAGVRAVAEESQGIVEIEMFGAESVPALLIALELGNERAGKTVRALNTATDELGKGRMGCGGCGGKLRAVRDAALLGLVHANRDDAVHAMAFALCEACAEEPQAAAMRAIREFLPDARKLDLHQTAGHA